MIWMSKEIKYAINNFDFCFSRFLSDEEEINEWCDDWNIECDNVPGIEGIERCPDCRKYNCICDEDEMFSGEYKKFSGEAISCIHKPDPFDLDKEIALFDEKVDMLFRSESSSKDVEVWDIKFPSMNDNDDDCEENGL